MHGTIETLKNNSSHHLYYFDVNVNLHPSFLSLSTKSLCSLAAFSAILSLMPSENAFRQILGWLARGRSSSIFGAFAFAFLACNGSHAEGGPKQQGERLLWEGGPFTFSDELGGFRITAVTGTGTKVDPIVITEELLSATPVTLVIRANRPIRPYDSASDDYVTGFTHFRFVIQNASAQAWIEFEFELQEIPGKASVFGDGLSFDQRRVEGLDVTSDSFATFNRDFEPYDRLLFQNGKVDPKKVAGFSFMITDFTPRWEFYLVQDPRIPAS